MSEKDRTGSSVEGLGERSYDLSAAKATALEAVREWGPALGEPFEPSCVSHVAPAGNGVLKVAWEKDDESYLRPAFAGQIRALL